LVECFGVLGKGIVEDDAKREYEENEIERRM
jgi:hypothetical protein